MKRSYCLALALVCVAIGGVPTASAALVHRFSFDDANIVGATKGQANLVGVPNAEPSGSSGGANITTGQPGRFGQAYSFQRDATGATLSDFENLLTLPSGAVPSGNAERTFSLWFNQTEAPMGSQNKLFGYGAGVAGQTFDVSLEGGGIRIRNFGGFITYGSGFNFLPGGADEGWRHLAVRVNAGATTFGDGLTGSVNVFLDGVQLNGVANSAATPNGATRMVDTAPSVFGIGTTSLLAVSTIANGFTGLLDEFRIYDNALSDAQIAALAVPEPSSLLALSVGLAMRASGAGRRRRRRGGSV